MQQAIICVDDEAIILVSLQIELRRLLVNTSIQIYLEHRAADAIHTIQDLVEEGVEVVILISDWSMPEMKGDELFKIVHRKWPKIELIMLSGFRHEDAEIILNHIPHHFVGKPWDKKKLEKIILNILKI